jgi:hypothetical protein
MVSTLQGSIRYLCLGKTLKLVKTRYAYTALDVNKTVYQGWLIAVCPVTSAIAQITG